MKNIQENIYRVKTLMNLLTEGSTNPNDWKVGEYYIQTRKGSNERNIIKITYKDDRGAVTIWANTIYQIENEKIVKSFTFYNEADALRQLGYVFINPNDL